jgi:uncharacterized Ntn-hydrolase superfamily protein
VEAGVGAIATQANTEVGYGKEGLRLLGEGFSPQRALEVMLTRDPEKESRQVIIIDKHGRTAGFTGKATIDWKGHLRGKEYVVAGNMLRGGTVLEAMAEAFDGSAGELLPERLMKALEAGQKAGGDKRGEVSAALVVAGTEPRSQCSWLNLRIEEHADPVNELRSIFKLRSHPCLNADSSLSE